MKTTPTALDIEAASLFKPAPGMRAWCRIEGAEVVARFLRRDPVTMHAHAFAEGLSMHLTEALAHDFDVVAIDTDDPATVGVMLAQVEDESRLARADEDARAELMACWNDFKSAGWRVANQSERGFVGPRCPTRGAALVAAMKALKSPT